MPKLHVGDQDQSPLSYSYKNLCNMLFEAWQAQVFSSKVNL